MASFIPHYDFTASKVYCQSIGLKWLGDEWLMNADADANAHGFTQGQFDIAMRHMLWHVKTLFTPSLYGWRGRIILALHFLFGG